MTGVQSLAAALRDRATPETLGHFILRGDPQSRHVPEAERSRLVAEALADGARRAAAARARWGDTPDAITRALGLAVDESAAEGGYGTTVVFAEYCAVPRIIRLYHPAIDRLNVALADPAWRRLLGIADATPVFLAHEIYHHLDMVDEAPIARRYPVTLLRLGAWRWTSGIAALSEIAAGSFAQRLLGLPVHAKLLDFVALHAADPALAAREAASLTAAEEISAA